ncbi:MAG: hypothetical protein J4F32_05425 [Dehalococcoidia bacterium]|nr:hypothetical protein [Dehalococcoidia bacterium]
MLPRSSIRSENTQAIAGHPGLRPDIIVAAPDRAPVVIEAEYLPAHTVEPEAKARLGLSLASNSRVIEAAIALRYPADVSDAHDLQAALSGARLSYCVFTEAARGKPAQRFPESGWLEGGVDDLADMLRLVSVPQRAVEEATAALEEGIEAAAKFLDEINARAPGVTMAIARLLGMTNVGQTWRMACAILANALVFHERIAGMHADIKPLSAVYGSGNPQSETLAAWEKILTVNYWAIFAIAKDILQQLPAQDAAEILRRLRGAAQRVNSAGVDNAHDLTGRVFQRLIADRKYLATFYTLPASAALLARLAVAKMDGVDWSSADAIAKLRVGDFACGTGALLSAVYEQIAARHERAGGNAAKLHKVMMEQVLYGCDVMPSAVHITGSTLSGVEPSVAFTDSRLYTMPYGRMDDGSVKIGSLELLQSSDVLTLFNTSDPAKRTGSAGEETAAQVRVDIPDAAYDLIIMNPPFTRATNHEGAHADITNPAFAAFGATDADQTAMGARVNRLGDDTCYHGNAGIASAFVALAHKKLKPGGALALVLPLTMANGMSWEGFRRMLARDYTEMAVMSIISDGRDVAFSSDTAIAECLVVARKLRPGEVPGGSARFTSLNRRPQSIAHASALASRLSDDAAVRRLDDGPYGGTPLMIGIDAAGESLAAPIGGRGSAVRVADPTVAQTAHALSRSGLWLPGNASPLNVMVALLDTVGKIGVLSRDITGPAPRGPFDKMPLSSTSTYPALWNHDATKETRMVCEPDSQLRVRQGMEEKAATVWATASRAHLTIDFTLGSQPLAAAFTERPSIGGRAWPNVAFDDARWDYVFLLWANCTLGLLSYWWRSSRQQPGRSIVSIRAAESLPVLDFRALSDAQLATAERIFDEFRDKEFKPAYLADADPNRALLDRRVICDLLGFDEVTYRAVRRLAQKWCAEPSVHGGKPRPKDARFVA